MSENRRIFSKNTFKSKELQFIKKNVNREDFISWLNDNYDMLSCYHSTRTNTISDYYLNGLVPTNMVKAKDYFRQLLQSIGYGREYDIQETIELFTGDSDKRIYFCLDREDFLEYCPHYLIYGSELILCFAERVSPSIKYELKKIGIPTIFHCDIPLANFNDNELISLYDKIIDARGIFKNKLSYIFSNYSVVIRDHVPAKHIIHHEHPTQTLWDSHCNTYYKNDISFCPHCAKQ